MKTIVSKTHSATPDTRYEREKPSGYTAATVPATSNPTMTWSMWEYKDGAFVKKNYGIRISDKKPTITPDQNDPSAEKKNGVWIVKSGYGFSIEYYGYLIGVTGYTMPASTAYTGVQSAYATFPEFGYSTATGKYRTLEKIGKNFYFEENDYADHNGRIHFTPLWYPDGNYCVAVTAYDFWTPAGMATARLTSNAFTISGSAYDDWFLGR